MNDYIYLLCGVIVMLIGSGMHFLSLRLYKDERIIRMSSLAPLGAFILSILLALFLIKVMIYGTRDSTLLKVIAAWYMVKGVIHLILNLYFTRVINGIRKNRND